jgi:hypothetical protein
MNIATSGTQHRRRALQEVGAAEQSDRLDRREIRRCGSSAATSAARTIMPHSSSGPETEARDVARDMVRFPWAWRGCG